MVTDIGITLEERECANGCGLKFKVVPGSTQVLARANCKNVCFGLKRVTKKGRYLCSEVVSSSKAKADNRMDRSKREIDGMVDSLWEKAVRESNLIKTAVDIQSKMDLASYANLACRVRECDISVFAKKIAYDKDKLLKYIEVRKKVFEHLTQVEADCFSFELLCEVADKVKDEDSKRTVRNVLRKHIRESYKDILQKHRAAIKNAKEFFCDPSMDMKLYLDQEDLRVLKYNLHDLTKVFDYWEKNKS